jgi:hypothetical protein
MAEDIARQSNLELVYDQYHWIARYYHWSRLEIKHLPISERRRHVERIIEHERMLKGITDPLSLDGGED